MYPHDEGAILVNSLIFAPAGANAATNCAFVIEGARPTFVNCIYPTAESVALDADYRPTFGVSAVIDAGTNVGVHFDDVGDVTHDLDGTQRIMNGTVDIGAFEADWRPRYGADISRRVRVTEASPCVVETARKGVSLGKNGTVVVTCLRDEGDETGFKFSFVVAGNGVLTIAAEGIEPQTFTQSPEKQMCLVRGTGNQSVRFSYQPGADDAGSAEILRASRDLGMAIIVR